MTQNGAKWLKVRSRYKYFANPARNATARYSHSPSSGNRVSVIEKIQEASDSKHVGSRRTRFDGSPSRGSSVSRGPHWNCSGKPNRRSAPTTLGKLMSWV